MTPRTLARCGAALGLVAALGAPPAASQVEEHWRQPTFANRLVLDGQDRIVVDGFRSGGDFVAEKYASDGSLIWSTVFGHPTINEHVNWLACDSQGAVILTGHMHGATGGLLTVKFDPDGNVLWSDVQNVGSGEAERVEVDPADNVVVVGRLFDPHDNFDFYTVKYRPDGAIAWTRQKTFGPGSVDLPRALSLSPSGRVAVSGQVGSNDFATVVYDADGNELWEAVFLDGKSGAQDVRFGPDDAVFVCGMVNPSVAVVVGYDAAGGTLWEVEVSGPDLWWARFNRLSVDREGNVIAAGYGNAPNSSFMDWLVAKIDPQGQLLWTRRHGSYETADEWALAVDTGPRDEIYVSGAAGTPRCSGSGRGMGTAVIRYDAEGNVDWLHEAACSASISNSVVLDSLGEVVFDTGPGEIVRLVQEEWVDLGFALAGGSEEPRLAIEGYLEAGSGVELRLQGAPGAARGWHVVGLSRIELPFSGGTLLPALDLLIPFQLDAAGETRRSVSLPPATPSPLELYVQSWILDARGPRGMTASNAVGKAAR